MKEKRLVLVTFGILLVLSVISLVTVKAGPLPTDTATNSTDTATVGVTILNMTMIEIQPTAFVYTGLYPGDVGNASHEAQNFTGFQIENIGSTNITRIWLNTTYPGTLGNASTRPFGKGLKGEYDAGNFVVISQENANQYFFVNRVEYNETRSLIYIQLDPGDTWYYGRIRNASNEFFWVVNATSGNCSQTGTEFRLGNLTHTRTQTGTVDFRSTNKCGQAGAGNDCWVRYTLTYDATSGWGVANITLYDVNGNPEKYCLAVHENCDTIMISHWNKDAPGANLCDQQHLDNFWNVSGGDPLYPGNSTVADIQVRIPYGVASGQVKTGYIRVWAETADNP